MESFFAGMVCVCFAGAALAADGVYVGMKTAGRFMDPTYAKDVANSADAASPVDPVLQGRTLTGGDSASGLSGGVGIVSGYRLPFGADAMFYVSGEVEAMLNFGSANGRLAGASDPAVASDGLNRLGEHWPDTWSFRNKGHYGFTFKLGMNLVSLPDTSVYGLAGMRFVNTLFTINFDGCLAQADARSRDGNPANDTCSPADTGVGVSAF